MGQGQSNSLDMGNVNDLLSSYRAPIPGIVGQYEQNLTKGGLLDMPSFNELFNTYRDVADKEAGRQAASLTESFGSMGGRYGSDVLNAQSRLRENQTTDLASQAAQYQLGLRGQQFQEASGIANLEYGANEAGMTRLFEDFFRRTSPPPGLGEIYGIAGGYGLPATVIG